MYLCNMKIQTTLFALLLSSFSLAGLAQSNPALKAELEQILASDQEPRNEYVAALQAEPKDSALIQRLIRTIVHNDSVNTARVTAILDRHGFPAVAEVGDVNIAVWAVIQHSDIRLIDRYMPLFLQAARHGDLPKMYVATMYDRCEAWHGRPQKYGTQGSTAISTASEAVWVSVATASCSTPRRTTPCYSASPNPCLGNPARKPST